MFQPVVTKTIEVQPIRCHPRTWSIAEAVGLSQSANVQILNAFGLKPHKADWFKLSTEPDFVRKSATSSG